MSLFFEQLKLMCPFVEEDKKGGRGGVDEVFAGLRHLLLVLMNIYVDS